MAFIKVLSNFHKKRIEEIWISRQTNSCEELFKKRETYTGFNAPVTIFRTKRWCFPQFKLSIFINSLLNSSIKTKKFDIFSFKLTNILSGRN